MTTSSRPLSVTERWWRWLDGHAEASWNEWGTAKYLSAEIRAMGVPTRLVAGGRGILAEIGNAGPVSAVRADMDALWFADGGAGYARHSCGHSAHMAIALTTMALIRQEAQAWDRRVRFIFQPAEETCEGALRMIEEGALEDVDVILGMHLRPGSELPRGFSPAIRSGATRRCTVRLIGADAHGARPFEGRNVIDPIMAIHGCLKSIYFTPSEPWSAKITRIQAGGASTNVIPGHGEIVIDCRAQSNEVMDQLQRRIDERVPATAATFGVDAELHWWAISPAAEVGDYARSLLEQSIVAVAGPESLAPDIATPGADDFHYYTVGRPEISGAMLGIGCELTPGLHHPETRYDTSALEPAARVLADALRRSAKRR